MSENKKGYWIYSIFAVAIGMFLLGFWGYLIYDLILKLSVKDFSNNTVVQALLSLVGTVFIGGYFSKSLERKNAKKLEVFKIQRDVSLKVVDYATILYYHPDNTQIKELLAAESIKVKLYFDDKALIAINEFQNAVQEANITNIESTYGNLTDQLKKSLK